MDLICRSSICGRKNLSEETHRALDAKAGPQEGDVMALVRTLVLKRVSLSPG
jgi:hypothetical protein